MRTFAGILFGAALLALLPEAALAQTSAIAGVVKDTPAPCCPA